MNNHVGITPAISVVFTSYNHKEYLRQALDAIINQTFKKFELIIVDDCSTDGSQEILKEYANREHRIRLFLNNKNSGSYVNSTNYGASLAVAPYIIFAQCDDWAESRQLELLYEKISSEDVGVVFSCSNMVDAEGEFLKTDFELRSKAFRHYLASDGIIKKEIAFSYLLDSCIIPNLSAALIRKDLFYELNGFSRDYLVLADWDFWLRISQLCDFYYIRHPQNNFRQHNTTIRSSVKIEKQIKELFSMYYTALKSNPIYKNKILSSAAKVSLLILNRELSLWPKYLQIIYKYGSRMSGFWVIYMITAIIKRCMLFLESKFYTHKHSF